MPIYEYRCSECGNISEILTGVCDENDPLQCKTCGSSALEKIPTFAAIATPSARPRGKTCCGREERCDKPPCSSSGSCARD